MDVALLVNVYFYIRTGVINMVYLATNSDEIITQIVSSIEKLADENVSLTAFYNKLINYVKK